MNINHIEHLLRRVFNMKNASFLLMLVVTLFAAAVFADDADIAERKAAYDQLNNTEHKAIISVHNDTIAVQLDDADGQFNIGKWVGSTTLTYAYPSAPWSSWTCFVIDGTHYSNDFGGFPDPSGSSTLAGGAVAHPFTIIPHSGDSSYIYGGWTQSGLDIYQTLMPVYIEHDTFIDAFIFIKYNVTNTSAVSHTLGIILQLDTMIDWNDAAELATIWGYSGIEEDWVYDSMPPWWFAYRDYPVPPTGTITAMGILDGFDAVRPNRFAVGSWPSFNSFGTWTYTVSGAPYGDSSVLYWWGIDTLAPGDTMVAATYYGIGHPFIEGDFSLVVDDVDVANCVYTPNPFNFFAMFTNSSAMVMDSVMIHLDLPAGLVSISGATDTILTGGEHLGSFASGVMSWDIEIVTPPASDSIRVWVTSTSVDDTFEAWYVLSIPLIGMPPQGSLIEPTNLAWTTCDNQEILLDFTSENGMSDDDITFALNGTLIDLTDPHLSWEGDTLLRYTPSPVWSDGDTVGWSLVAAVDAVGCSLIAPVYGEFFVDLTPPVAENEWPEDGQVLGTTDIPLIWVELYDILREVDPASILFTINGTIYDITDSELEYRNDSLFFDPVDAGMVFEDGDTVCISIDSVTDVAPDYCDVNEMDSYEWCFYFNIIDIWMPDTQLCPPGDTFDIPVYCEDITGLGITQLDITVRVIGSILEPVGINTAGTVTAPWALSFGGTENTVHITGSGTELTGGGVLFYLRFYVPTSGSEGAYSPLEFVDATFNSGALSSKPIDGFATVCFTTHLWTNDILFFVGEQNRKVLTFGCTPTATDGYNPGLDIQYIPTPAGRVDGWFDIDDPLYPVIDKLNRDIRAPEPVPIVWTGYAGCPGVGEVEVLWSPGHFPDGEVTLYYTDDGVDYVIDMRHNDRCSFTDEIDFVIVYDQPEIGRVEMVVCPGWNLISFPFIANVGVTIPDAVPTSITPGYWFNNETRTYEIVYNAEPGKGYWVYCTEPDTFLVAGMLVDYAELNVGRGWNLVGTPWESSGTIPVSDMEVVPDVLIGSNIWGWDGCGAGAYFAPTDLAVGQGYWVLCSGTGLLSIEGDSTVTKVMPVFEPGWVLEMQLGDMPFAIGIDNLSLIHI